MSLSRTFLGLHPYKRAVDSISIMPGDPYHCIFSGDLLVDAPDGSGDLMCPVCEMCFSRELIAEVESRASWPGKG
jgi:hypothetical protein